MCVEPSETAHVRCRDLLLLTTATAVLGVGLSLPSKPATAQSTPTATAVTGLPARRVEATRRLRPALPAEDDDTAPPPQTTIRSIGEPGTDDPDAAAAQDGDDPARPTARRPADGEPQDGIESPLAQDGVLPVGEPEPARRDGDPTTDGDPRLRSDIDAFERPAAGYDAVAFQIDSVDPVLDRRPARLARFEPYDPIGLRAGSWIVFPELEWGIGATTNVRRATPRDGAGFSDVRPTVRAVTNWRVHAIELRATGFGSAFQGFATENDKAYAVEARGRYEFSRRTSLEVLVAHSRDQEGRQARDAVDAARDRGDIDTTRAAVALNHRFNRLAVQLRGSVTETDFAPVTTVGGGVISNEQRDLQTRDAAVRTTYTFKPTLSVFADVQAIDRHYRAPTADGILRDSTGWRALAGVSFGNTGQTWRGELGLGFGRQTPDDARIGAVQGVLLDANLGWRVSELTSLLFTARTDLNDSTAVGQNGSIVQTLGAEVRHALRRHLIGTAALRHVRTDYKGVDLLERETTAELGLEYFLNRSTTLFGRYSHVVFDTTTPGADYTVDTVRFGVRWRQ